MKRLKPSSKNFLKGGISFVDHLCFLCLVPLVLFLLFIAALWPHAWKWPDHLALVGDFNCTFVTFPCGILGQVWYLIVSFPDLCHLSYVGILASTLTSRTSFKQLQNS